MEADRLEQAIHRAVAATATPNEARLAAILAQVERARVSPPTRRKSTWPWLLLAAAAGVAAAGGNYWYTRHLTSEVAPTPAADRPPIGNGDSLPFHRDAPREPDVLPDQEVPAATPHAGGEAGGNERNTAVIYRR